MILGIDPGSRVTGYGVICSKNKKLSAIEFGTWVLKGDMSIRLAKLQACLTALLYQYPITAVSLEQSFVHLNVAAALKLGQVRGVVMATVASRHIALYEYATRQVKQAIVGTGAATKEQVQHMISKLLALDSIPSHDAADALALAVSHLNQPYANTSRTKRGRTSSRKLWTHYDSATKR